MVLKENYKGLDITPLRPFTRYDWMGYAGAAQLGEDEPLIYNADEFDIIVAGTDDDASKASVGVYLEDGSGYSTSASGDSHMSIIKAIRLAKRLIDIYEEKGYDDFIDEVDTQMEEY